MEVWAHTCSVPTTKWDPARLAYTTLSYIWQPRDSCHHEAGTFANFGHLFQWNIMWIYAKRRMCEYLKYKTFCVPRKPKPWHRCRNTEKYGMGMIGNPNVELFQFLQWTKSRYLLTTVMTRVVLCHDISLLVIELFVYIYVYIYHGGTGATDSCNIFSLMTAVHCSASVLFTHECCHDVTWAANCCHSCHTVLTCFTTWLSTDRIEFRLRVLDRWGDVNALASILVYREMNLNKSKLV